MTVYIKFDGEPVYGEGAIAAIIGPRGKSAAQQLYDIERIDEPTAEAFDAYLAGLGADVSNRLVELTNTTGVYNAIALAPWFKALADMRAGIRDAVMLWAGDSTFTGDYRTGMSGDRSTSLPSQTARLAPEDWGADDAFITGHNISGLTAGRDGLGNDGIIWDLAPWNAYQDHAVVDLGPGGTPTKNAPVEFGAAGVGGYAFELMPYNNTNSFNGITYKPRDIRTGGYKKTDRLTVYYITTAVSGGSFRVYCDGGLVGTVNTVTGEDGFDSETFEASSLGEHTWRIENDGTVPTQDVFIAGFFGFDSSRKQVRIINGGRSGWPASQYAHNSPDYGPMPQTAYYDPDLEIDQLAINSARDYDDDLNPDSPPVPAMTPEEFRADTAARIEAAQDRGKAFLLLIPRPVGTDVTPTETQTEFANVYIELAAEYGCALFDLRVFGDSYEVLDALGFMADTRHPNQYADAAAVMSLLPAIGGGVGGAAPVAASPFLAKTGGAMTGQLTLAADPKVPFRFDGALPAQATLTRSGSGTYFDANGVLQTASTNVARFDHRWDGSAIVPAGLLVERASTNLIDWSRDFSNAYWAKSNLAVTLDSGPDVIAGGTGMAKLTLGSGTQLMRQNVLETTTDEDQVASFLFSTTALSSKVPWLRIIFGDATTPTNYVQGYFNPTTGLWGTVNSGGTGWSVIASGVEPIGNGIYRAWLAFNPSGTSIIAPRLLFVTTDGGASAAASGAEVYMDAAQLETGTRPTSIITTAGGSASRAADVATLDWSLPRYRPAGPLDLTYTFGDGSTQAVTGVALTNGAMTIPTNLNRSDILSVAES